MKLQKTKIKPAIADEPTEIAEETPVKVSDALEVKVKKLHPLAVVPSYAKPGDAGMDLTAVSCQWIDRRLVCKFGLAFEIPQGYVGLIFPRSSIFKYNLALSNAVGVIDSGYRGEVSAIFNTIAVGKEITFKPGERIAQMIIIPHPHVVCVEADELSSTERGVGGFGSTGV